jgi:dTDP-4-dehydrorhamnose reductase
MSSSHGHRAYPKVVDHQGDGLVFKVILASKPSKALYQLNDPRINPVYRHQLALKLTKEIAEHCKKGTSVNSGTVVSPWTTSWFAILSSMATSLGCVRY